MAVLGLRVTVLGLRGVILRLVGAVLGSLKAVSGEGLWALFAALGAPLGWSWLLLVCLHVHVHVHVHVAQCVCVYMCLRRAVCWCCLFDFHDRERIVRHITALSQRCEAFCVAHTTPMTEEECTALEELAYKHIVMLHNKQTLAFR